MPGQASRAPRPLVAGRGLHLYEVHGAVAEVGDDVDPLLLRQELYLRGIHDGSYLELQRGLATGRYRVTRFN